MPPKNDKTITFSLKDEKELEIKQILFSVCSALAEKGYNAVDHIVGYLLSEDPTYITNHRNARSLIRKVERDEILTVLLKSYLEM